MTTRHKPSPCTGCGKVVDSSSTLEGDAAPRPGDISICFYCHHIMAYADDLTLRELTDDERIEVAGDADILVSMRALGAFKKAEKEGKL